MRSILAVLLIAFAAIAHAQPDRAAIVKVIVDHPDRTESHLTGSLIEFDGRVAVVTNSHGFDDGVSAVHVYSGDQEYECRPVYIGKKQSGDDVAVLRINGWNGPAMRMADADPQMEQDVYFGGFPSGRSYQMVPAKMSGWTNTCWKALGVAVQGQSGSALVDTSGRVLGLVWGTADGEIYIVTRAKVENALRSSLGKLAAYVDATQYCPPGQPCDQGYVIQPQMTAPYRGNVAQPLVPRQPTQNLAVNTGDLIEQMAKDPRFKGQPGPPGRNGDPGPPGLRGERGPMPDSDAIRTALLPVIEQLRGEFSGDRPVDIDPEIGIPETPETDWISGLVKVATALGLEVAVPGGAIGMAGVFALRTWLRYRKEKVRSSQWVEPSYPHPQPTSRPQPAPVDAGRSSITADHPQ